MGLFINNGEHPEVFENKVEVEETNQGFFKTDYLSELVKEQKEANDSLQHSVLDLKNLLEQQKGMQVNERKKISHQLNALKERNLQHEKFESHVMETLDDKNKQLQVILKNEDLFKQEVIDQINIVSQSNQEIVQQLEKYESVNEQLVLKLNEQFDLQKQLSDQISKQEDSQSEMLSRLNNQEALMEKILRQIDHFRATLFERTHFLAEKVENGYNLTSSYITKLITGSDQPLTFYMKKRKKEDEQKSLD